MRVLVLSDIHANLTALDAVLADAGAVDAVWQLGDVVGYGPDPDGVVDRLRELGATGVRGNHDAAAVGGDEIEWFNPDARRAMEWTRGAIGEATAAWLRALEPVRIEADAFTLVHGSPRDPLWEYILSKDVARANLEVLETPYGLHGHTHMPVSWRLDRGKAVGGEPGPGGTVGLRGDRMLLNPGSVGQPRDGDPRSAYLVLEPDTGRVTWHRVAYDIASVQDRMTRAGLPKRLVERLTYGA